MADYSFRIDVQRTHSEYLADVYSTSRVSRRLADEYAQQMSEAVMAAYDNFLTQRVRGALYTGTIVPSHLPWDFQIGFRVVDARRFVVIVNDEAPFRCTLNQFREVIAQQVNHNLTSSISMQILHHMTEEEELAAENASLQELHNQRYAIANVDHSMPGLGTAPPADSLTAQSVYTQNVVNPQEAVYLQPDLDADGRVTALYNWENVRRTLGQNPIESPLSRRHFTVSNVHRMAPDTVQRIINR